jgi:uncharacterized protein
MPGGNGTGPLGRGPVAGGGRGRGGKFGAGSGGNCLCPKCKMSVPHVAGVPCYNVKCPKCGTKMNRE